jgi:hypothetical protein
MNEIAPKPQGTLTTGISRVTCRPIRDRIPELAFRNSHWHIGRSGLGRSQTSQATGLRSVSSHLDSIWTNRWRHQLHTRCFPRWMRPWNVTISDETTSIGRNGDYIFSIFLKDCLFSLFLSSIYSHIHTYNSIIVYPMENRSNVNIPLFLTNEFRLLFHCLWLLLRSVMNVEATLHERVYRTANPNENWRHNGANTLLSIMAILTHQVHTRTLPEKVQQTIAESLVWSAILAIQIKWVSRTIALLHDGSPMTAQLN